MLSNALYRDIAELADASGMSKSAVIRSAADYGLARVRDDVARRVKQIAFAGDDPGGNGISDVVLDASIQDRGPELAAR